MREGGRSIRPPSVPYRLGNSMTLRTRGELPAPNVPGAGLEPTSGCPRGFKIPATTDFATRVGPNGREPKLRLRRRDERWDSKWVEFRARRAGFEQLVGVELDGDHRGPARPSRRGGCLLAAHAQAERPPRRSDAGDGEGDVRGKPPDRGAGGRACGAGEKQALTSPTVKTRGAELVASPLVRIVAPSFSLLLAPRIALK